MKKLKKFRKEKEDLENFTQKKRSKKKKASLRIKDDRYMKKPIFKYLEEEE